MTEASRQKNPAPRYAVAGEFAIGLESVEAPLNAVDDAVQRACAPTELLETNPGLPIS